MDDFIKKYMSTMNINTFMLKKTLFPTLTLRFCINLHNKKCFMANGLKLPI